MKEIDFVGHFNKEWECCYESFSRPPAVTGSELRLYYKVLTQPEPEQDSTPVYLCRPVQPVQTTVDKYRPVLTGTDQCVHQSGLVPTGLDQSSRPSADQIVVVHPQCVQSENVVHRFPTEQRVSSQQCATGFQMG